MKRLLLSAILLAIFLPAVSHATVHEIHIMSFAFTPSKVKVNYGDTVRWINMDPVPHNSIAQPGAPKVWNSGTLSPGNEYQIVINPSDGKGPFPYSCTIHPGMDDTIFVATKHTVRIENFDFVPAGMVINPGDTVVWQNMDAIDHTSTSDPGSPKNWDSGLLPQNATFEQVFTSGDGMGPFPYHCTPHPGMTDTLYINPLFCCAGTTGNVDMVGIVNLADLSLLIDYLTPPAGPTLPCTAEANIDATGIVNLADLSLLIDYLTPPAGPSLPNCP